MKENFTTTAIARLEAQALELKDQGLLLKNCDLLGQYTEGCFTAFLWKHRLESIHGLTMLGEVKNEPAFSDESNSLTQLFRALKHLESLTPQRLVVDWQLHVVEATPEGILAKTLRKLSQRRCTSAIVLHKKSNHAAAVKLLSFCQVKKSVPQAIGWLRAGQGPKATSSRSAVAKWIPYIAGIVGILTFLFFVALSTASLFHFALPVPGRFPAVVVLALGGTVSSVLFDGHARVDGPLSIPFVHNGTPMRIRVVGGAAILVILLILGKILFG